MKRLQQILWLLVITLASGLAGAQERVQPILKFDIQPQPIDDALNAFAKQSGLQVILQTKEGKGITSPRLVGMYTAQAALEGLLANSGLAFEYLNARTVAVRTQKAGVKGQKGAEATAPADSSVMLAQGAETAEQKKAAGADGRVEEMLVEGERDKPAPFSTANLDLTRTEDDVLPFTVFTARDIELSGAADLQEFFQKRLPQNFNPDIPGEIDGSGVNPGERQSRVDMRGWGANETVFLLNGRPMTPQYQAQFNDVPNATPNLQGIPLASIERIEILSSAGSVIYGSNATGGVINIITRRDFRGGQFALSYESPMDVHAPRRSADFSYGLPLKWGMGLRLQGAFNEMQPLKSKDRAAVSIERWRRLMLEREPTRLLIPVGSDPFFIVTYITGATPNIRAGAFAGNLFEDLSGARASNFSTVPAGYDGSGGLADFQPGAYSFGLAEGAAGASLYARDSSLGTVDTNTSFSLGLDKDFSPRWRWSADYRYSRNQSEGQPDGNLMFSSPSLTDARPQIPGSAPGNPFGQAVSVVLVDPRMQRPELTNEPDNVAWELSSTLRGGFGKWEGFFDLSYSQNSNHFYSNAFWEPYGGWIEAFVSGDYNPLVDVRTVAPAAPEFYDEYIALRVVSGSATRAYQSALKVSGPLVNLPAGALRLTLGAGGSRIDRYKNYRVGQFQDAITGLPRIPVAESSDSYIPLEESPNLRFMFDSYYGYSEANVPLASPAQNLPLLHELELFGSGRVSSLVREGARVDGLPVKYTTRSHVYAYGLRYAALEGVELRASQSLGFKPPSMSQVTPANPPTTTCCTGLVDPRRNRQPLSLPRTAYLQGGNPNLLPETTDSMNFGLMLRPRALPNLRVSVDYLDSTRNDAIFSISAQEMLNFEADFPDRVVRGDPDGHASGVGRVIFLDRRNINLREISSKSVDFSVEQIVPHVLAGQLVFAATATRNLSFKVQTTNTTPAVEQIRNVSAGFMARQIEWNGNAQLRWEGRRWGFGWSANYFDYLLVDPADYVLQGSDRAPWKLNHDVSVNYSTAAAGDGQGLRGLFANASFNLGIKNVFDREPRFWANTMDRGIAPYDSVMGRSVWLQMRKSFE